jgi:hypothetical protein
VPEAPLTAAHVRTAARKDNGRMATGNPYGRSVPSTPLAPERHRCP